MRGHQKNNDLADTFIFKKFTWNLFEVKYFLKTLNQSTWKFYLIFHFNDHCFFLIPWFLLPDILWFSTSLTSLYKSLKFSLIKAGGIFKDQFKLISIQSQLISSFNIIITKLPLFNQTKTLRIKWLAKATFVQIKKTFVRLSWVIIAKCFFIGELLTARTYLACVKIIRQKKGEEEEEVTRNARG